ncbi:hypothetical protein Aba7835_15890 [Acinetobacter baumannii]|nr:hypothetical protein Aba7835_15890 [Acinetobacter baumannii]
MVTQLMALVLLFFKSISYPRFGLIIKKILLIVHILEMRVVHFVNYISLENYLKLANSNMRCDSLKSLMIINKLSKFL